MLIKNLKYFILSLHGLKQLTMRGPHNHYDYDPLSIAQVGQCDTDFKAIDNHEGWSLEVKTSETQGLRIQFFSELNELQIFEVAPFIFSKINYRPWKHTEDLSNDAQAWLRPGGA